MTEGLCYALLALTKKQMFSSELNSFNTFLEGLDLIFAIGSPKKFSKFARSLHIVQASRQDIKGF